MSDIQETKKKLIEKELKNKTIGIEEKTPKIIDDVKNKVTSISNSFPKGFLYIELMELVSKKIVLKIENNKIDIDCNIKEIIKTTKEQIIKTKIKRETIQTASADSLESKWYYYITKKNILLLCFFISWIFKSIKGLGPTEIHK